MKQRITDSMVYEYRDGILRRMSLQLPKSESKVHGKIEVDYGVYETHHGFRLYQLVPLSYDDSEYGLKSFWDLPPIGKHPQEISFAINLASQTALKETGYEVRRSRDGHNLWDYLTKDGNFAPFPKTFASYINHMLAEARCPVREISIELEY